MEWRFWARTRPAQFDASGNLSGDDCEAIEPLLSLYGDGMASPAEARLVEAHLPGCESCRESLAWMLATRRALSGRPVLSPPVDLHARIAEAIAASDAAPLRLRPARTFTTRPAFAAAASLAAVGLFLGYSLTHLPHPGVAVKPVPPVSVATVPNTLPPTEVAPVKPTAPSVTVKKPQPAPLVADSKVPDNTLSAPDPVLRVPAKNTERPIPTAPTAALPTAFAHPHLKPVAPRPNSLIAVKPAVIVKHTPAPLPTKAPPLVASADTKGTTKEPDVHVLPAKVTPQESVAPVETASAVPNEPRVQNVDYVREVRVRLPSQPVTGSIIRTVGLSLRGVSTATRTFGPDKTPGIDCIHGKGF